MARAFGTRLEDEDTGKWFARVDVHRSLEYVYGYVCIWFDNLSPSLIDLFIGFDPLPSTWVPATSEIVSLETNK